MPYDQRKMPTRLDEIAYDESDDAYGVIAGITFYKDSIKIENARYDINEIDCELKQNNTVIKNPGPYLFVAFTIIFPYMENRMPKFIFGLYAVTLLVVWIFMAISMNGMRESGVDYNVYIYKNSVRRKTMVKTYYNISYDRATEITSAIKRLKHRQKIKEPEVSDDIQIKKRNHHLKSRAS